LKILGERGASPDPAERRIVELNDSSLWRGKPISWPRPHRPRVAMPRR
jgi:hypothetical protein